MRTIDTDAIATEDGKLIIPLPGDIKPGQYRVVVVIEELVQKEYLESEVEKGGNAYVRNLAAAEAAILRGQFNVAKVLRAVAHAQRVQAMQAARVLAQEQTPAALFGTILTELEGPANYPEQAQSETVYQTEQSRQIRQGIEEILKRAIASLENNSDVLESDVAQSLWGCYGCGNIIENNRPEVCPVCGALGVEFEWFGPFYGITPEHLGQLTPAAIVETLQTVPEEVAATIAGMDEAVLRRQPTESEWCAKDIIGHMIETHFLFARRALTLLNEPGMPLMDVSIPPWKLHEGKGYEELPTEELVNRLRQASSDSLKIIQNLEPRQWARHGNLRGSSSSMLDLATWVANHDKGHLAQVRQLCGK